MDLFKSKIKKALILLAAVGMTVSCAQVKDIAYFQNRLDNHPEKIDMHTGIVIQPKDMISIVVSSRNPELVPMFNLPVISYQAGSEIVNVGQQRLMGYVVDNDGYIDFPVLGQIQVGGMTRWQLSETIKDRLLKEGLLNDAVVTVEFMNFKVSVLGEVNHPGTFSVEGDKITVLQAISLAGDLTIYGNRTKVMVLRQEDGMQRVYGLDLTSGENVYSSPAYYLQQNDIIYVEPNKVKARQSTVNGNNVRSTSFWISLASLLTSVAILILN